MEDLGLKFGVVLFDLTDSPERGWASAEGEEAIRIEGTNMLASNTIWLTNLNWAAFNIQSEMNKVSRLRQSDYFPVPIAQIMKEWNRDPASSGDYTATFCSQVFSRVMNIVFRLAKSCNPSIKMRDFFVHGSLRDDIKVLLPKLDFPTGEAESLLLPGSSYEHLTRTSLSIPKGSKMIKLVQPRLSYATSLLTSPVPSGEFRHMTRSDLRRESSDRVNWVYHNHCPVMAEILIDDAHNDLSRVYNFGSSLDSNKRNVRAWAAHPEFLALSSFSTMRVNSAYIGTSYTTLGDMLPPAIQEFLNTPFSDISWSAGVVAELIWKTCLLTKPRPRTRSKTDKMPLSWQGLWLKAADKAMMFAPSMALFDMGYTVVTYGSGWIQVYIQDEQRRDVISDALGLGFMPLISDIPDGMFNADKDVKPKWGGDMRALNGIVSSTMQKNVDMLWSLDKIPLYDADKQKDVLRDIVMASRKKKG